jgi:hypothetical protein
VRLGGIYALEWVATSSPVASILTAYVRGMERWRASLRDADLRRAVHLRAAQ